MQTELLEQDQMIWDALSNEYAGGRILAAECSKELLERIRSLSPVPELVLWSEKEQREFCRNQWPEDMEGNFRYVLLGRLAERLEDIYALKVIRKYLAYNGAVISLWGNVQHWSVIRNLLDGNWHYSANPVFQDLPHSLFSQKEILNTFRLLKYKDIRISYLEQAEDEMELRRLQSWSGIKDPQLLRVAFWCVEAHMFNENVTELQGELTSEVRKELGRMLRRIEHGIEPDVNCTLVKELCRRENISEKYLTSFIQSVTMSPKIIWGKLRECSHE